RRPPPPSLYPYTTLFRSLSWGRILVGAGVSACLMAPFTYFRRNFPPHKQAQLGLWLLVAGTSGAVTSTWPAAAMAEALGWRAVLDRKSTRLNSSHVKISY